MSADITTTGLSTYHPYKADSARVDNWLGRTAIDHGYSRVGLKLNDDVEKEGKGNERSAKQVRNARKKAMQRVRARAAQSGAQGRGGLPSDSIGSGTDGGRKTTADTGSNGGAEDTPGRNMSGDGNYIGDQPKRYIITVNDYFSMTAFIVKKDVPIPFSLLRILARCIRLRKRSQASFPSRFGGEVDGHEYMITALQRILGQLATLRADQIERGMHQREQGDVMSNEASKGGNRYAEFAEVAEDGGDEETGEDEDGGTESADSDDVFDSHADTAKKGCTDSFSTQTLQAQLEYHMTRFLFTVHDIRQHLHAVWRAYGRNVLSLVTAATAAHTATNMVSRIYHSLAEHAKSVGSSVDACYARLVACTLTSPEYQRSVNSEEGIFWDEYMYRRSTSIFVAMRDLYPTKHETFLRQPQIASRDKMDLTEIQNRL